jgi:NAD(P)-dependent dehydrogenase (short-subunit alcohol dehydrogenase family)
MPLANITGHTALVTGAARRLGRAIALALAHEGANVVLHYRSSREEAEALRGELADLGVCAWTVQADLADEEAAALLIPRAWDLGGALDILVNNAADFPPSTLENVTRRDLERQIAVAAWAPFVLCRELARRAERGMIVNLLDSRMTGEDWSHVAYLWAKQLLVHMTAHLALAYAPDFTVNGVAPGLILPPAGRDESYLDALADTVPLRRHGYPEDIAAAVIFLLKSSFITGEVIFVDGGRHLGESVSVS